MERIVSTSNKRVMELKKLAQKKYRTELGLYLIEGAKMVADAVAAGVNIAYIAVDEEAAINFAVFEQKGYNVYSMPSGLFRSVCDTVTPQGIIAAAKIPVAELSAPEGNCVILDGISDAGNLGTIIRTAAAAGFWDIYLINCVDAYNPKCVRSTMSGLFWVRLHECGYEFLETVKARATLIGADMSGKDYRTYPEQKNAVALVIGNESHGISERARAACDSMLSIPMARVESLNAAVAAGILMYKFG